MSEKTPPNPGRITGWSRLSSWERDRMADRLRREQALRELGVLERPGGYTLPPVHIPSPTNATISYGRPPIVDAGLDGGIGGLRAFLAEPGVESEGELDLACSILAEAGRLDEAAYLLDVCLARKQSRERSERIASLLAKCLGWWCEQPDSPERRERVEELLAKGAKAATWEDVPETERLGKLLSRGDYFGAWAALKASAWGFQFVSASRWPNLGGLGEWIARNKPGDLEAWNKGVAAAVRLRSYVEGQWDAQREAGSRPGPVWLPGEGNSAPIAASGYARWAEMMADATERNERANPPADREIIFFGEDEK